MMHRWVASLFILLTGVASAQAADDNIVGPLRAQWAMTSDLVVKLAETFPEGKYDFKATPEIRTVRDVLNHMVFENQTFIALAAGDSPPDKAKIEAMKSKAEIMKALADSYAYGARTLAAMTDAKAVEKITFRGQPAVRWYPVLFNIQDSMNHYGNLVILARLNGIVPPRTAAAQAKK